MHAAEIPVQTRFCLFPEAHAAGKPNAPRGEVPVRRCYLLQADPRLATPLPGGPLEIRVPTDPEAGVRMRGPARVVFEGRLTL